MYVCMNVCMYVCMYVCMLNLRDEANIHGSKLHILHEQWHSLLEWYNDFIHIWTCTRSQVGYCGEICYCGISFLE